MYLPDACLVSLVLPSSLHLRQNLKEKIKEFSINKKKRVLKSLYLYFHVDVVPQHGTQTT